MAVVLDSDAVVGFLDRSDALHAAAKSVVHDLIVAGDRLLASVVTFAEVLTGAKLGHHDEDAVRGFFRDLVVELVPVDSEVAERAATLRARRKSLRMPDALVLASADLHPEVDLVVCGDRKAMQVSGLRCRVRLLG
jgi:predicted nucleic acid-binding protein